MRKCIAANWKMFKTGSEARNTVTELLAELGDAAPPDREILIIPPFTALRAVAETLGVREGFALGAQDFYPESEGSYTGEISPDMLLEAGCAYALAGHSERRHIMGETDDFVARKVSFGLAKGLNVILCIGETLEQRKAGRTEGIIESQLGSALREVSPEGVGRRLAVAYEPVWAIGTGEVAGPEEIGSAHSLVRRLLREQFGEPGGEVRILYGGSVKPDNSPEIMRLDNVDGVLVGGASLKAESFGRIVLA
jgi:triosephosphate isomerase